MKPSCYEKPRIHSVSAVDILETVGPAQALASGLTGPGGNAARPDSALANTLGGDFAKH